MEEPKRWIVKVEVRDLRTEVVKERIIHTDYLLEDGCLVAIRSSICQYKAGRVARMEVDNLGIVTGGVITYRLTI